MVFGFTMIKVMHGHEDETLLALKNTIGVKEVHHIIGEYTFFVIMQAENNMLLHRIIDMIKNLSSVTRIWHILVSSKEIPKHNIDIYPLETFDVNKRNRNLCGDLATRISRG